MSVFPIHQTSWRTNHFFNSLNQNCLEKKMVLHSEITWKIIGKKIRPQYGWISKIHDTTYFWLQQVFWLRSFFPKIKIIYTSNHYWFHVPRNPATLDLEGRYSNDNVLTSVVLLVAPFHAKDASFPRGVGGPFPHGLFGHYSH